MIEINDLGSFKISDRGKDRLLLSDSKVFSTLISLENSQKAHTFSDAVIRRRAWFYSQKKGLFSV